MDGRTHVIVFLSGILSEIFLFSRGEWDRYAPDIVRAFSLLGASTFIIGVFLGLTWMASLKETAFHGVAFFSGLFGSMGIYRWFFHPLRTFSGPQCARLTSFWIFFQNYPDLKFYTTLRQLHDEYGDFVRIRPREISICHPDAVIDVHGPRTKLHKGEFYDQAYPHQTLQFTRNVAFHRQNRILWDRAFQAKSVKQYMPRLKKHYGFLMNLFQQHAATGDPLNASRSFLYLSLDLISELTFGESFNLLSTGKTNAVSKRLVKDKKMIGFFLINVWTVHIIKTLAKSGRWKEQFIPMLEKRKEMNVPSPDLYTHLSRSETWEQDRPHEAGLALVAGSDTVAVTLTNICYFLSQYPDCQRKMHDEIAELPHENGLIDDQHLAHKPLLSGFINETLRLCPPVPSGLQRLTPPEGAVIAGQYIPGNMFVSIPTYSLQRDRRAFANPDQFIPERWSSQPELILRKDAFVPFSYGTYNCAGKSLAMTELRMITAMIVRGFTVSFPIGKEMERRRFVENQADAFVLDLPPLSLVLKERT